MSELRICLAAWVEFCGWRTSMPSSVVDAGGKT